MHLISLVMQLRSCSDTAILALDTVARFNVILAPCIIYIGWSNYTLLCALKFFTVLTSSMATVIGPTPPGTGVMSDAT